MSRWKAAAIHLGISFLVLLTLGSILAVTWYPPDYLRAVGGLSLMGILAGVDACLGPLLTLIIYKAEKPGLRFDLSVIALCQVAALGYGIYTIFMARPVYMVYAVDRFEMVRAVDISPQNLAKATREEYRALPLTGPKIIGVRRPEDPKERESILFSSVFHGEDLQQLPRYYVPYQDLKDEALKHAKPLDELMAKSAACRDTLNAYVQANHLQAERLRYLALRAEQKDQTVLVDAITAEVLGIVDLDPWQEPDNTVAGRH